MNLNNLCPGCMQEMAAGQTICPYCGFNRGTYQQNSRCLPVNTILAGKYLVGRVIGQGGFGITYMGFDLNMETRIAIKEYFPVELASRDTTVTGDRVLSLSGEKSEIYRQGIQKYVDEARNVSRFSGTPGVISVKDFFYENETAYIVMEYIEGESLKDYLKRTGRLTENETCSIMRPVLEALIKIHESGMIHRDISPDNIMLTFGKAQEVTSVKLIDFGAARMTARNDEKSLTIILKHGYAPEEQYRTHGEQGPWTDIYAVCATMYRMLTGETPVPAMDRIFQDNLKCFEELDVSVSLSTAAAILKGLAVKRENRISSVQELIGVLYEGKKVRRTRGNPAWTAVAVSAAVAAVVLAGVFLMGNRTIKPLADGDASVSQDADPDCAEESGDISTIVIAAQEDDMGEEIAAYQPHASISSQYTNHILFCLPDGTVKARGSNEYGQCRVEDWSHMVAVSAGMSHSLGLRSDGKVFAVGNNVFGQCSVENWSDVIAISAGSHSSYGLTQNGTILAAGSVSDEVYEEISTWTDITAIVADNDGIVGVDRDGTTHYAGLMSEKQTVTGWTGVIYMENISNTSILVGLKDDGSVVWAIPDSPNEGIDMDELTTVASWTDIQQIDIASGTMGVRKDGTAEVYVSTDGVINVMYDGMEKVISQWDHLVAAMAHDGVIYGIQEDGTILQYARNLGNTELADMKNLEWVQTLKDGNSWTRAEVLIGKTQNGQILSYGSDHWLDELAAATKPMYQDQSAIQELVSMDIVLTVGGRAYGMLPLSAPDRDWLQDTEVEIGTNLTHTKLVADDIYVAGNGSLVQPYIYAGLTETGQITIWSVVDGAYQDDMPWLEENIENMKRAETWQDVVYLESDEWCIYGVHKDGTISSTGDYPELKSASNVEKIAAQSKDLLALHKDGTVEMLIATDNAIRQGKAQVDGWRDIQDIAMGESHCVGLRNDGTVVAAGSNHCGQCDVEDWSDIIFIAAGRNITLGITKSGDLKVAGELY